MDWKARAWHIKKALEKGDPFLVYRCKNCDMEVKVDYQKEIPNEWENERLCIKCFYEEQQLKPGGDSA